MFRFARKFTVRPRLSQCPFKRSLARARGCPPTAAHVVSPELLRQFSTNGKAIDDDEYNKILKHWSKNTHIDRYDYYNDEFDPDPCTVDSLPSKTALRSFVKTAEDARHYGEERAKDPLLLVDGSRMSPYDLLLKFGSSRAYVGYTAQEDPKKRAYTEFCSRLNVPKKLALASGVESVILAEFTPEEFPNPLERTTYARNCEGAVQKALHEYDSQRLWKIVDRCKNPKVACKEEATLSIYFTYIVCREMLPSF